MPDELSLKRCPCCRARLRGDEKRKQPCRRCEADLSTLRDIYRRAAILRGRAQCALKKGLLMQAIPDAHAALNLVDVKATRQTLAAVLFGAGYHTEAISLLDGI